MKLPLKMILQLLLEASTLSLVTGTGCSSPLGMQSRDIEDDQLTASSFWDNDQDWHPREARLENTKAWYPYSYATNEWLQIDLLKRTYITGIQTQGHWHSPYSYYASSFKLRYSDNGNNWITFQERGSDKVFDGNNNYYSVNTNDIIPAIQARFIRISAERWPWWSGFAFRLELLGCELQSAATTTTSTLSTANVATTSTGKITTVMTTKQQTTRLTKSTTVTTEGATSVVPQRSTSSASSGPGTPSPASNNTSGNSDGSAGNQTGTPSVAIIGGAVASGVVLIIAIIVFIVFIRRRRSKPKDGKEQSPQADEGTVDNIYYGGVTFAANGNASTNGNVSIGQSEGTVDNQLYAYSGPTNGNSSSTDQSEGIVDNHLYAGTSTTNGTLPIDQSEGTVDNHLYAGTGDACLETRDYDSVQDSVYYNVAHTSDEGVVENDIYC